MAIGDSTLLLSLPGLAATGYDANAHGCRQFVEGLALLRQLKAHRALPHMVVIALGANGNVTRADIVQALRVLCCKRLLVLVTPRQAGSSAAIEREQARVHPDRILLLDWVKYSSGHPSWFQPDGLHLTWPGVYAFNALLEQALPYAYQPCPPRDNKHARRASAARRARTPRRDSARTFTADASVPPLTVSATLAPVGYVGVSITGPAGAQVQLSEQLTGQTTPLQVVQLSALGTATVSGALTWRCDLRQRQLLVTTIPPAAPAAATTIITTPSCSGRLATHIASRARVGRTIVIRLRDRWGIGGLPVTICITPPGGGRSCSASQLPPGESRRVVQIPASRPGGWRTTVQTPFSAQQHRTAWVSHPGGRIRLLAAGDSEMQILDDFMAQDLRRNGVNTTNDARISTGLTNSFFFNWPDHARRQAPTLRPDVTVIFMGANDGFSVAGTGGRPVGCCGAAWSTGYADLAAEMMRAYLRRNAGRVYWFLLPTPRPANFQGVFNAVNAGIREAADRFPGRVSLIDANAFFTPGNRYRDFMTYHGRGFVIHESDGIHLSTASDTIAARLVTDRLRADHVIR